MKNTTINNKHNCNTVADIICNNFFSKHCKTYVDNVHNYVFVIGDTYRRAFKVSSTKNSGLVYMSFPMSKARCKIIAKCLQTPKDNGNIVKRHNAKTSCISSDDMAMNEWLEGMA